MNKIVCYVCGTSYPENAAQCPICGYVQSAEKSAAANTAEGSYTYVKGGRFSKANVKKRNQAKQKTSETPVKPNKASNGKKKGKSNVGTIVLIAVLLLAIIAVVGYIALRFFLPNDFLFEGLDKLKLPGSEQMIVEPEPLPTYEPTPDHLDETEAATVSLACTGIQINAADVQLEGIDSTYKLAVTLEPADTPDPVFYSSSNEVVAKVSDDGTITAVSEGTAVITVTCGSVSAECTVICAVPEEETIELTLNRKEITFNTEGQSWVLYDGVIPVEEVTWSSDDNKVATIENGKVVAVGEGDTIVYGLYGEQTAACVIHCNFDENDEEGTGAVSEAGGDSGKTYTLYNPYGHADDVTINVDETFILKLVDENLNDAAGVDWSVKNENVCSFDGNTVKGVNSGVTEISAICEGRTYTCIVRVN